MVDSFFRQMSLLTLNAYVDITAKETYCSKLSKLHTWM